MPLEGRLVAVTAGQDGIIRFWDVLNLRELVRLTLPSPVMAVVPAGGTHLAVLCDGEAMVYARTTPQQDRPTP